MAFKKVVTLFAEKTINLTKDQKSIVGTYLGTTSGPNALNPNKPQQKHFFETESGVVAVWGMTNLDIGMKSVSPGAFVRATYTHQAKSVKPGRQGMKMFDVEVDSEQFRDVGDVSLSNDTTSEPDYGTGSDSGDSILEGTDEDYQDSSTGYTSSSVSSHGSSSNGANSVVNMSEVQAKAAALLAKSRAGSLGAKRPS